MMPRMSFHRFHQGRRGGATAAGGGAGAGSGAGGIGSVMGEKVRDPGSAIQSPGGGEGESLPDHDQAAELAAVLPVPAGQVDPGGLDVRGPGRAEAKADP